MDDPLAQFSMEAGRADRYGLDLAAALYLLWD
jgi:hypothetical protein